MSYYRGDYYRGDYYRGDPGFLSFLGGAMKAVGGFIPGVGGIVSGIGSMIESKAAPKAISAIEKVGAPGIVKSGLKKVGTIIQKHPVLTGAGAAGVAGVALGAAGSAVARRIGARGGKTHRRMRVTNPKALRRAIRRAKGFAHLAKQVLAFTERKPHRGRAVFKLARKKRM